jgi:hypothetical protein
VQNCSKNIKLIGFLTKFETLKILISRRKLAKIFFASFLKPFKDTILYYNIGRILQKANTTNIFFKQFHSFKYDGQHSSIKAYMKKKNY